jgi:hypothetical protein
MPAVRKPNGSPPAPLRFASLATWPSTSNWTPWPEPVRAAFTNRLAASPLRWLTWTSKVTVANATWPDGEIWAAVRGP